MAELRAPRGCDTKQGRCRGPTCAGGSCSVSGLALLLLLPDLDFWLPGESRSLRAPGGCAVTPELPAKGQRDAGCLGQGERCRALLAVCDPGLRSVGGCGIRRHCS